MSVAFLLSGWSVLQGLYSISVDQTGSCSCDGHSKNPSHSRFWGKDLTVLVVGCTVMYFTRFFLLQNCTSLGAGQFGGQKSLGPPEKPSKSPIMCFARIKSNLPHDYNQRCINNYCVHSFQWGTYAFFANMIPFINGEFKCVCCTGTLARDVYVWIPVSSYLTECLGWTGWDSLDNFPPDRHNSEQDLVREAR